MMRARLAVSVWLVTFTATAIGCSNLGPFRASGSDDDAEVDAAVGGADGHTDSSAAGDAHETAQPRELASSTHYPTDLAAAGRVVYFTEAGIAPYGIGRVSAIDGAFARMNLGTSLPGPIAASSSALVWTTSEGIMRANSAFTGAVSVVSATLLTGELALSSTDVYYGRHGSSTSSERLERVAVGGGTPVPLYTNLTTAPILTATSTDLYWTAYGTGYEVRKSSLSSPDSFSMVEAVPASDLSSSGDTVCWMQQPDPNQYKYDVWCHRQGTTLRIARGYDQIFDLLVTADDVFIAVRAPGNVGEIERYRLSTSVLDPYITLAGGDLPTSLATDGTDLFWLASHVATEGSGTVYALAL